MATPPIDKDGGFVMPAGIAKVFAEKLILQPSLLDIMKKAKLKKMQSDIHPMDEAVKVIAKKMADKLDEELMELNQSENQVTVEHDYLTYPDPVIATKDSGPLTYQVDTLQYQRHQRPGTMRRDMSTVPCRMVAAATKDYYEKWNDSMVKPEQDAISFYLMNHGVAEIANRFTLEEPIGPINEQLFNTYHDTLADAGLRLFYYLLLICTRETRHINDANNIKVFTEAKQLFADELLDFVRALPDDSMDAAQAFMNMKSIVPIGEYCNLMCYLFNTGKWSSSFGGKKWGVVADALNKYVHGIYSLQLLLDVGFALAHNGGPIFNKYMLYESYNGQWLRTILDCQRAGQIPQFVNSKPNSSYVTDKHIATVLMLQSTLGDCMMGDVDWHAVKAAGAIGNYDHLMKITADDGHIIGIDPSKDAPESLKKAAKEYTENLKKNPVVTHFQVMPDVNVPIMKG